MKTFLKRALGLGALAAAGYAVWRGFARRKVDSGVTWNAQPFPYPPRPRSEPLAAPLEPLAAPLEVVLQQAWVEPEGGRCPASHPVKTKLASGIFHMPGSAHYDRTNADRCYATPEAAAADGLRPAKR
jgi:hypothetical protein